MSVKHGCTYLEEAYELATEIPGMPCDCDAPNDISQYTYQAHGQIWKHKPYL
jgi:hypothetical protein